jgi:two-component system, OmpR family, sensor kinase
LSLETVRKTPLAKRMFDSVRVRLTLWYTGVLALVLSLLAVFTYLLYARDVSQKTDSGLVELSDALTTTFRAELGDQSTLDAVKSAAHEAMIEHRFRDTVFALLAPDHGVLLSSLELPAVGPSKERLGSDLFSSDSFQRLLLPRNSTSVELGNVRGGKNGFRAYARPVSVGNNQYTLAVLQSLHPQAELLEDIRNTFLGIIPAALLLASIGGYFLARKSLAPVVAMASQARNIGALNLHGRLAVPRQRDEMGQLAFSFNQLLDRLEESFDRQRRFIADASHELRTPVAILRGETEVTLSRTDRTPEEYRESLAILRDESQRLTQIIEDLFTLTRADAGEYPLNLRDLYLDELAADVLLHARSLAIARNISLSSNISPELMISGDEALLRRMILNLIDNAIKYTLEGGAISLECRRDGDFYLVSVSDSGPGIPFELHERIFERFVRADKARSRSETKTAGAGLGLSIARWIAEAHHGRLKLISSDSAGSTFTAFLPRGIARPSTG